MVITFKLIRKIGKLLRGGAGRKEILLGTLFGVLIGFCPGFNFSLLLLFLLALLLNSNFGFTAFGAAIGKLVSLPLAAVSFHIGFFIIHKIGLEGLFSTLCNAPVTALMDLNVYAVVGSFPIALILGIALGSAFGTAVLHTRQKMLDASQHEIIGKTFGNKVSRLLLRLAFGKSKLSLDDEVAKTAPWLRKSGVITVAVVLAVSLLSEFVLLNSVLRKSIESSISKATGAEVNVGNARFSIARGEIAIENLQITDPDEPEYNMIQLERVVADLGISELLSRSYAIDLLAGSKLRHHVLRESPGAIYTPEAPEEESAKEEKADGTSLEDYLAAAEKWKKYGRKAYDYLQKWKKITGQDKQKEKPVASKEDALARAKAKGYWKADADLTSDKPAWVVRRIEITDVKPGGGLAEHILTATEISSHPELNGKKSAITLTPEAGGKPTARIVLRFDDPAAHNTANVNLPGIPLGENVQTSDSFPLDLKDGKVDLRMAGQFDADSINLPFTLMVHDLQADVEPGETVLGMDSETATEVFSSIEELQIDGAFSGSLLSPRITVDYEKLTANLKEALVAAGKKKLADRAGKEVEKAREELSEKATEEIEKALGGEEAEAVKEKAKNALKKLF